MFLFLWNLLVISNLLAFEVIRDVATNSIHLTSPNCDELRLIKSDLNNWLVNISAKNECSKNINPKIIKDNSLCSLDISKCIPEHVLKYQDVLPKHNGPNCWNLSLVMRDILPGLRYSSADEMAFYMSPPLCRSLNNDEERKAGDVGAIRINRGNKFRESHGFIYISDKIAYSKNGYTNHSRYSLQTYENVLDVYEVDKDQKCRQNKIDPDSDCNNAVSFYRCISINQYLENSENVPNEILNSLNQIQNFERCSLQPTTINGEPLNEMQTKNFKDSILVLTNYLIEAKKEKIKDEKSKFIIGSIQLRLKAISTQLEMSWNPQASDFKILTDSFTYAAGQLKNKEIK
jgi:hypothetical protein